MIQRLPRLKISCDFKKKRLAVSHRGVGNETATKNDNVAYVRFASVYRSFEDVSIFKIYLMKLNQKKIRL